MTNEMAKITLLAANFARSGGTQLTIPLITLAYSMRQTLNRLELPPDGSELEVTPENILFTAGIELINGRFHESLDLLEHVTEEQVNEIGERMVALLEEHETFNPSGN
jgi:hypothetical protein